MPYVERVTKAGNTIEIERYFTSRYKKKGISRGDKVKPTKEEQEKVNTRQAEALGIIAENVRKAGLSVLCFTGALIEDLRVNPLNKKLLNNIDLLIDGEFMIDKIDYSRPWCGSSNQRYHFLTSRYNDEIFAKYKNKVEVNISKSGVIFMNGMGNFDEILQKIDLVMLKK